MTRFGPQLLTRLGGRTAPCRARAAGAGSGTRWRPVASPSGPVVTGCCRTLVWRSSSPPGRRISTSSSSGGCRWNTGQQRPVFVIVDRPDTGDRLLQITRLPVAFARGSAALEELVAERDVRVVLYLNQLEANFRMLRFASPVHIQIGHGESDKAGSVSNQHKAYDLVFVGGDAGRDRLDRALRGFDAPSARWRSAVRSLTTATRALPGPATPACGCGTRRPGRVTGRALRTGRWPVTASRSSRRCSPTRRSASSTDRTRGPDTPPASIAMQTRLSDAARKGRRPAPC